MVRPFRGVACCLAGLAIAACGEQPQQESPSIPQFASNSTNVCAPNVFNSLIAQYFLTQEQQSTVTGHKNSMLSFLAAGDSTTARTYAFHILREIAAAAKGSSQPSPSVGSELAVEVFKCPFDVTDTHIFASPPSATFFEASLDHAAGGGFEVRGKLADLPTDPGDPTGPVQAVSNGLVIAALAPFGTSWDAILPDDPTLNPPSSRVLIYGKAVGTATPAPGGAYDWSKIPRAAVFADPGLLITTCFEEGLVPTTNVLTGTFETSTGASTGALAYGEATFLCSTIYGAVDQPRGAFALVNRLVRIGRNWLTPEPLAAATLMPGIVGGRKTGLSVFDIASESFATFVYQNQPQNAFTDTEIPPPVTVRVTGADGKPLAGANVAILFVNNNGVKVKPTNNVATSQLEVVNGQLQAIAKFVGMTTNKAGGYRVQLQPQCATPQSTDCSSVSGRPGIGINIPVPLSNRFNVQRVK